MYYTGGKAGIHRKVVLDVAEAKYEKYCIITTLIQWEGTVASMPHFVKFQTFISGMA